MSYQLISRPKAVCKAKFRPIAKRCTIKNVWFHRNKNENGWVTYQPKFACAFWIVLVLWPWSICNRNLGWNGRVPVNHDFHSARDHAVDTSVLTTPRDMHRWDRKGAGTTADDSPLWWVAIGSVRFSEVKRLPKHPDGQQNDHGPASKTRSWDSNGTNSFLWVLTGTQTLNNAPICHWLHQNCQTWLSVYISIDSTCPL